MPTHGSLTKAGKVRDQTPKVEKGKPRKSKSPRIRNRHKYKRATLCPACGQRGKHTPIQIGDTRCWRCETRLNWKGLRPVARKRKSGLGRRFR